MDSKEAIHKKVGKAFCPAKQVEKNPVLNWCELLVFREKEVFTVGKQEFNSFEELEKAFANGKIHPADLKPAVADVIDEVVAPVRAFFKKNPGFCDVFVRKGLLKPDWNA